MNGCDEVSLSKELEAMLESRGERDSIDVAIEWQRKVAERCGKDASYFASVQLSICQRARDSRNSTSRSDAAKGVDRSRPTRTPLALMFSVVAILAICFLACVLIGVFVTSWQIRLVCFIVALSIVICVYLYVRNPYLTLTYLVVGAILWRSGASYHIRGKLPNEVGDFAFSNQPIGAPELACYVILIVGLICASIYYGQQKRERG